MASRNSSMGGGGVRQRQNRHLTLDTAIDDSREQTTKKSVARFPNRFSSTDGHPYYHHRMGHDFLFSPSLPCPSLSFVSPPRRPYAGIFPPFALLRAAGICPRVRMLSFY